MANIGTAQKVEKFLELTFYEARNADVLRPLQGESKQHIIHVRRDIEVGDKSKRGEKISFDIARGLSNPGYINDAIVFEKEEEGSYGNDDVTVGLWKKSTKVGKHEALITNKNVREDARWGLRDLLLREWYIKRRIRKLTGLTFQGYNASDALTTFGEAGTTNTNIVYPTGLSSVDEIGSEDHMTVKYIRDTKRKCLEAEFGHIIAPGLVNGYNEPMHALLLTLTAMDQLKDDPDYKNAVTYSLPRSKDHPWFSNKIPTIEGVALIPWAEVLTAENTGGTEVAKNLFLGRQAYIEVETSKPITDAKGLGYKKLDPEGIAIGIYGGGDKATWDDDSVDNGVILMYTSNEAA